MQGAPSPAADPAALEAALGRPFDHPALLREALTHPSWAAEHPGEADNQRLEFLGDAVVGLLLADRVYRGFAASPEGELTRLRAALACGAALARKARQIGLGAALRLGNGERATGGADRPKNLEDAMEAVFGAVYLDGGLPAARKAFDRLFAADLPALAARGEWAGNPRGALQDFAQKRRLGVPEYAVERSGPDHAPVFTATAALAGRTAAGTGPSKHAAQATAAAALLARLEGEP